MAFKAPNTHPTVSKLNPKANILSSSVPSSSPAFGTPVHPLKPFDPGAIPKTTILPIILPPATLRPLAFRIFTKKHSLTLTSSALQELAGFVGKHCGAGWKEEGLAEKVLEEAAKSWKSRNGGVIVNSDNNILKEILRALEGSMQHGKILTPAEISRQQSVDKLLGIKLGLRPAQVERSGSNASIGLSKMAIQDDQEDNEVLDPRKWLKVIDAWEQPRYMYNVKKRQFDKETLKPSILPPASAKTDMFRNRYQVIHQRLLRNEAFQESAVATIKNPPTLGRTSSEMNTSSETYRITPIAHLLGRHGTHHMLLGMLSISPTGTLVISDLTGTIDLDLAQALCIPEDSAWFSPGMIVLVDGVYEEEEESHGKGLAGTVGVGGTLGGRFQGFFIGQPPCERRKDTLGVTGPSGSNSSHTIGGGFGWIDFLGVGSERAVGSKMRRLEQRILRRAAISKNPVQNDEEHKSDENQLQTQLSTETQAQTMYTQNKQDELMSGLPGRNRIVIIGELNLDNPRALQALRKVLATYAAEPEGRIPISFVLSGSFMSHPTMARTGGAGTGESAGGGGSVEYKECFDELSAVIADYPSLLEASTFILVPGDNDGWASSFGGGAAAPLPRKPVPQIFVSRIRRTIASVNADADKECEGTERTKGEIIFASNPARISMFGPVHEVVLFRDDISARLRRNAIQLKRRGTPEDTIDSEDGTMPEAENGDTQASDDMDVDYNNKPRPTKPQETLLSHDIKEARKLVKTILDQGYLSPFRTQIRPVHWSLASTLHLYPLPTAMVLIDTTIPPFAVTYEGCHVVNSGSLLVAGRRGVARWAEYTVGSIAKIRECMF